MYCIFNFFEGCQLSVKIAAEHSGYIVADREYRENNYYRIFCNILVNMMWRFVMCI